MTLPEPVPGLVIRYSYLWASEHRRGQEEGVKDRPCAVVTAVMDESGDRVVTVLPITHTPPSDPGLAVEIPHETKLRLGLDDLPSWIVVSEVNRFTWPGPDLRPNELGVAHGLLPRVIFKAVQAKLAAATRRQLMQVVGRTQ